MENFTSNFQQIGSNLAAIRENCGKTIKQCAQAIGISTAKYKKYESSDLIPSLPEIEALSFFLDTPLVELTRDQDKDSKGCSAPDREGLQNLMVIRRNLIGTLIKIEREKNKISLKEIAKKTGITTSRVKKYENGDLEIPLNDLNIIAHVLELQWEDLFDKNSPIGIWQQEQRRIYAFLQLPIDTQEFLADPANHPYLSLVNQWKDIDKDDWRKMYDSFQMILEQMPTEKDINEENIQA